MSAENRKAPSAFIGRLGEPLRRAALLGGAASITLASEAVAQVATHHATGLPLPLAIAAGGLYAAIGFGAEYWYAPESMRRTAATKISAEEQCAAKDEYNVVQALQFDPFVRSELAAIINDGRAKPEELRVSLANLVKQGEHTPYGLRVQFQKTTGEQTLPLGYKEFSNSEAAPYIRMAPAIGFLLDVARGKVHTLSTKGLSEAESERLYDVVSNLGFILSPGVRTTPERFAQTTRVFNEFVAGLSPELKKSMITGLSRLVVKEYKATKSWITKYASATKDSPESILYDDSLINNTETVETFSHIATKLALSVGDVGGARKLAARYRKLSSELDREAKQALRKLTERGIEEGDQLTDELRVWGERRDRTGYEEVCDNLLAKK